MRADNHSLSALLSSAVARDPPPRMKHPAWLSSIGTFDDMEQTRDAVPENDHDFDHLTSRMSSLFSSPEYR